MWLEEPVPPEDVDAMTDIRQSTSTPICCGENLYMRWGYTELLRSRPRTSSCRTFRRSVVSPRRKNRKHGAGVLHPIRAPLRRLAHRANGFGPRLRRRTQLPGLRVALDQSHGPLDHLRERRRDHRRTATLRLPISPESESRWTRLLPRKRRSRATPWFEPNM